MSFNSAFKKFRLVPLEQRIVLDGEISHELDEVFDIELFDEQFDEFISINHPEE